MQVLLIQGEKFIVNIVLNVMPTTVVVALVFIRACKGSAAVQRANNGNLIRVILAGGYPPVTQHQPRPFGMPPLRLFLSDDEVGLVATYIRNSWGIRPAPSVLVRLIHIVAWRLINLNFCTVTTLMSSCVAN